MEKIDAFIATLTDAELDYLFDKVQELVESPEHEAKETPEKEDAEMRKRGIGPYAKEEEQEEMI